MFNVAAITPPLLLLHPIGQDGGCWTWLDPPHGVTALYPGHGGRERRPGATLGDLADEAVSLLEGRFDVLGVAMGGIVAQHVLVRHPDRVRSAVIACASGRTRSAAQLARAASCEAGGMVAVVSVTLSRWFTESALGRASHPGVAYARSSLLAMDPAAMADAWRALAAHDLLHALAKVRVPVTLVAGTSDAAVPVAAVEQVHQRLPNSRLLTVPGPHMLHLEAGPRLREVLVDHLDWVAGNEAGQDRNQGGSLV